MRGGGLEQFACMTRTARCRVNEQAHDTCEFAGIPPGCLKQAIGLHSADQSDVAATTPSCSATHAIISPCGHSQPAGSSGQRAG